ncbi:peptide-methionine (S)-S-oxide reductase [Candidatus Parcubacteria bacterium]|nr:MAG: peptide-methionine (S)-S-oxide reductase [Candidatus Parcubacteria bacterium]
MQQQPKPGPAPAKNGKLQSIVFGGGCFWCTEAVFLRLNGVRSVTSGYAGGATPHPTYEAVSSGRTGHAEVIRVEYDPTEVSLQTLLEIFFSAHDPTTKDRQGADIGSQYRSIILATTEEQAAAARAMIAELEAARAFRHSIVTEVRMLDAFWPAEAYHQDFYAKNPDQPYAAAVITPKLKTVAKKFPASLKPRPQEP